MDFNMGNTFDSFRDGTKELAEITHQKTKEIHEKYVSKVLPDCGKYGDVAKFIAEMAPGVAEYNAIREGDWKEFAIAAGLDITAVGIGAATAGAGYAAIKSGSTAAKTGTKLAVKEVAEAGTKKIMKKTAGETTEKIVKETVETTAEKIVKEVTETGAEKVTKETADTIIEKTEKELGEKIGYRYIECKNKDLEGLRHPKTGVEFVRKIVDDGVGGFVEGVFPKFESNFDAVIPKELYKESNFIQFKEANSQLLEKIKNDPSLYKKFTVEQIDQIKEGIVTGMAPDGFIWHHNEEVGILQLVDQEIHALTGHIGGRLIWGGGY